jgi:hypothetical protein
MLCSNCNKYKLLLSLEEYIVCLKPSESDVIEIVLDECAKTADESFICSECGHQIVRGESFIEDDCEASRIIFIFMAKQIMNEIDSCCECGDGSDIQGIYPSIKSWFYDEDDDPLAIFNELNTASTIEDLMNDVFENREEIWEPFYENIVEYVHCPHCDNGSGENYEEKQNYGTFDLLTEVYTKRDIDHFNHNFYGDEIESVKTEISKLAENFTIDELVSLKEKYIRNRELMSSDTAIYKLEQFIKELYKKNEWYVLSENRILFRTRTSPENEPLSKEELWEPPSGSASQGRYNDIGVSVFYCANNKEVVKKEVPLPSGHIYNIAKFIVHKPLYLFPINFIFGRKFNGLINESVSKKHQNANFKEEYIISNIVSAICYNNNYDGMVYRSIKDDVSIDYALFCNYKKGDEIELLDVEV